MLTKTVRLGVIVFCAIAASGCWVHYHYRHGPPLTSVNVGYIRYAPPSPRRVRIPPRPIPRAVWIGGYWRWTGDRYDWRDGYWDRRPPHGKVWRPGRWVHTKRGWYWEPGHWR